MKYRLVLASSSPRRKQLFSYLGINAEIIASNVDETPTVREPKQMVEELALRKASFVADEIVKNKDEKKQKILVVGSDSTVSVKGQILEKPMDLDDARRMLNLLKNGDHEVYTGVAVIEIDPQTNLKKTIIHYSHLTEVRFGEINSQELELYLKQENTLDKAGAYGINGPALSFVAEVRGCFANVMGFPLYSFREELKKYLCRELPLASDQEIFLGDYID